MEKWLSTPSPCWLWLSNTSPTTLLSFPTLCTRSTRLARGRDWRLFDHRRLSCGTTRGYPRTLGAPPFSRSIQGVRGLDTWDDCEAAGFCVCQACGDPAYLSYPLPDLRAGSLLSPQRSPWLFCHVLKGIPNGVFVG